jgi:hypothetical protein
METKKILLNTLQWGFVLWLFGYVLGIVLFALVPASLIGWIISPIGIAVTLWVLFKKVHLDNFSCYFGVGLVWTLMAVILDYLFLVKIFNPADGYYKFDVYLYYALTFILPILAGWIKTRQKQNK